MTNDEIKELLRDLAAKAEAEGEVKSRTVRINFSRREEPQREDSASEAAESETEESKAEKSKTEGSKAEKSKAKGSKAKEKKAGEESDAFPPEDGERPGAQEPAETGGRSRSLGVVGRLRALMEKRRERIEEEDLLGEEPERTEEDADLTPAARENENTEGALEGPEAEDERRFGGADTGGNGAGASVRNDADQPGGTRLREPARDAEQTPRKRKAPVEPADFESDAADFRNDEDLKEAEEASLRRAKRSVKERARLFMASLRSKGIGRRELIMIASGIVLLLLIAAVLMSIVGNRRKSRNVTADEGLRVTVEREPDRWCQSGSVTLGIRTDSPIQTILIDEEPVTFNGSTGTQITFETDQSELNLTVVCEDQARNARIGLDKIDSQAPVLLLTSDDGKIAFTATDDRSGVDGIWYGIKEPTIEVPLYQRYQEPFVPEEGKLYAYFARDKAGNVTAPVLTNLVPAQGMELASDQIALFPGETYQLQVQPKPANAFLNALSWQAADPQVISLDQNGLITALSDGETQIEITAEGLSPITCRVKVRSEASVTISAVGDVTLGEDVNFSPLNNFTAVETMQGDSYFFANVRDIFAADDITFANLEGTLTTGGTRAEKQYAFRGDPSYTRILLDGSVEAVTLANNHSADYGEVSLEDTKRNLTQAGIDYCIGDEIVVREVNGVKVGLIGIYALAEGTGKADQVESTIREAKDQGADIIIVAFHWGNESETQPDQTQRTLGHLAIDAGADLVVGHHPHVLQGIEKYAGKYICYSLGNFCFGGNSNPSDKDTMIFRQTFEIQRGGEIRDGDVSVIPCSISSDPSWNNYQPTPAEGEERERIMTKINELCEPFGTSF